MVVLGDQLDQESAAFEGFDPARDRVWMCEASAEATRVWSHKARIALFVSAMRHFSAALSARGWPVEYLASGTHQHPTLIEALQATLANDPPEAVVMLEPGEWALKAGFEGLARRLPVRFEFRADRHFLCSTAEFAAWMDGRSQPRLEHFYRRMRQRTGWLMDADGPLGGQWNFDADNREAFPATGPGPLPAPRSFAPDAITLAVFAEVESRYAQHPGSLQAFDWPVTRADALAALEDFIVQRLPGFGRWQDAMWAGEPWLFHARLSAALNLKLLNPREVCEAALRAHEAGTAPLAAVEGFVRQILGWREYVRGLYWHRMPGYLQENALQASAALPEFYWTAATDMNCLRETLTDTLKRGYAHHIQRLMVTGLYALLLGVRPSEVHEWYLAIYVDAVEWVELPNVLGMSQWADGGFMASKPYIASGKYIQRMSNYCADCRFHPDRASGESACPFTSLYWDFLERHEARFSTHPRLKMQVNNLRRKSEAERSAIRDQAQRLRRQD